jgi:hypothetical protein
MANNATGNRGVILASLGGINWTGLLTGAKAAYGLVSFCNNEFVALGDGGTISTSPDGAYWTNSSSDCQAVFTVGQANYVLTGRPALRMPPRSSRKAGCSSRCATWGRPSGSM